MMRQCNFGRKARQVQSVRREMVNREGMPFEDLLGLEWVVTVVRQEVKAWRACVYTPLVTIHTFVTQVLSAEQCCVAAVARLLVFLASRGRRLCSAATGPYCKARARLPEELLRRLVQESGQRLEKQATQDRLLGGRPIKLIDGTTVSMPDTKANQKAYPQSKAQRPGVGFPMARLVAVLSFSCGAVLGLAVGPCKGKRTGEPALLRQLWDCFFPGDVAVADCCYGSFWNFAMLLTRGVDSVFPLHQCRKADFRRGRRLGKEDRLVTWSKPTQRPEWMNRKTYKALPATLELREVRISITQPGFRTESLVLVTTLLDAEEVTRPALGEVYRVRWHAELDLRSIKVTMQMDVLRCKTPEMVRKEIWAHLLAYNFIRTLMAQAAAGLEVPARDLSFAGALQTFDAFRPMLQMASTAALRSTLWHTLLAAIGQHRVGHRPNRFEPRAVKRRPKAHKLLTLPRNEARKQLLLGTYS
jgi:hypothetical protein